METLSYEQRENTICLSIDQVLCQVVADSNSKEEYSSSEDAAR